MKNKFILVIDDDEDDTEIFIEAIKTLDNTIDVTIANNSLKALEDLKVSTQLPDYIFLDMQMPYLNGKEFLDEVLKIQRLKNLKIIFYSSHSSSFLEQSVQQHKEIRYLNKPNSFKDLVKKLGELLDET